MKVLILLASMLTSFITNPETRMDVFNERCEKKYSLITNLFTSKLIDTSNNVIETWFGNSNPYLINNLEYPVYCKDGYNGSHHFGIIDNKIIDLDINEIVKINYEDNKETIYEALTEISYESIPSNAHFCDVPYYFKNLQASSYGYNIYGTCTLVAMQILFSYYDATYLENVIENIYDINLSHNTATHCSEFTTSPASKGEDFHSYLINLCNNYYNIDIESANGLSNLDQNHLINHDIGAVRNISYTNITSEGNWNDIFSGRQFWVTRDAIDGGRPVIVNNLSHSMVAFAYDTNYLYLMSGWYGQRIVKMSWDSYNGNIFTNLCAAYDLIIGTAHSCTQSYYSNILGRYLCPRCGD